MINELPGKILNENKKKKDLLGQKINKLSNEISSLDRQIEAKTENVKVHKKGKRQKVLEKSGVSTLEQKKEEKKEEQKRLRNEYNLLIDWEDFENQFTKVNYEVTDFNGFNIILGNLMADKLGRATLGLLFDEFEAKKIDLASLKEQTKSVIEFLKEIEEKKGQVKEILEDKLINLYNEAKKNKSQDNLSYAHTIYQELIKMDY